MTPKYILENKDRINNISWEPPSFDLKRYDNPIFDEFEIMTFVRKEFINRNKAIKKNDIVRLYNGNNTYAAVVCTMIWGGINATRAKDKRNTFYYKFLSYPKDRLLKNIRDLSSFLEASNFNEAFDFFRNEAKIEGVGPSYFTKVFYFIGQTNPEIKVKPLILDKWSGNAYFALLLQNEEFDKATKFYRGINLKFSKQPGLVEMNSKIQSDCYQSYVEDFDKWSKSINCSSSQLEEFVFGGDLRMNRDSNNPRVQLWNIIHENLQVVF